MQIGSRRPPQWLGAHAGDPEQPSDGRPRRTSRQPQLAGLRPRPSAQSAEAAQSPIENQEPRGWTDAQLEALVAGKAPPRRIYEDGDKIAYYQATDAERRAWNAYVAREVEAFNSNPRLDSYDSVDVYPGFTRSGRQTPWIPPVRFPEWLAARKREAGR